MEVKDACYTLAISVVVSYEWFLRREMTESRAHPGNGRKVHTFGRSHCDLRLEIREVVGRVSAVRRRGRVDSICKINKYAGEKKQSVTVGFKVVSMSVGTVQSLLFCQNIN